MHQARNLHEIQDIYNAITVDILRALPYLISNALGAILVRFRF